MTARAALPVRPAVSLASVAAISLIAACTERSPQSACSSASALEPLKQIVLDSTTFADPALRKVAAEGTVSLERAVVESHDQATGKTECSGVLSYKLPDKVTTDGGRDLKSGIVYESRTAADGGEQVYTSPGIQLSWIVAYLGTIRYADGRATPTRPSTSTATAPGEQQFQPDFYNEKLEMLPHDRAGESEPSGRDEASARFSATDQKMIDEFNRQEGKCRMDTGPHGELACAQTDLLLDRMHAAGICWGRDGEGRADYVAHRCGSDSIR